MKTKNQIAQEKYGSDYKDLCSARKKTIDDLYVLFNEDEKKQSS